jgi:DNA helicase II / ATP-dependent DNA helicase PcrA
MTAPHAISAAPMTALAESNTMTPPYLAGLNPRQREAVEALDGPLLVLAGAGTGKTRVLTSRLIHLLAMRRAWPSQILAVTFTNKAAREMRERVAAQIGAQVEGLWLGTFHSLAARMLRRHAELVGLRPDYTILDTDDQIRLIKQLLEIEKIDDKKWPPRIVLSVIERWKDRGLIPEKIGANEAGEIAGGRAAELYAAYQKRLQTLNACDFGDLLLHCLTIFQTRPDVLAEWQKRFRYLLVDEYQDTNVAQYLWLRLLAQGHRNIACVGDDDQSIYSWRGAEIANILRFEKDFPGAKIVRLEQNYRSTGHILAAASGLIAHNRGRLGKTLWTDAAKGQKVRVRGLWDGEEEARFVGEEIEALQRAGMSLGEMAVLVRAGYQTREFEERLIQLGVPYRVVGGLRFYERLEIRDAVAYLRVIAQPADDLAFERIVNTPKRGIGEATLQAVHRLARARGLSLLEAVRAIIGSDELKSASRNALGRLIVDFDRWRARLPDTGPDELARIVLDESGYTAMWQADRSPEAPGRLDNLKELVAAIADFETLGAFLEHVSLVMENAEGAPGAMVTLMTLHAAKGLEFNAVFLPGWEEGVFPNLRALEQSGEPGLEEERRLAYVGLTRARQLATILFAANRRTYGSWQTNLPSRFLGELPSVDVEVQSMPGLWAGGGDTVEAMGTARAQARTQRMPPIIEGRAERVAPRRASGNFAVGDRVFHEKFGYGRVASVQADKLAVEFEQSGRKNVLDAFVRKG